MKQIVVTLENGADSNFLRRIIENMKGVLHTSLKEESGSRNEEDSDDWLKTIHSVKNDIDHSLVDMES